MAAERRVITGFSNPTVKALRALREKKHRKAAGKFLAEGLRLLTDARTSGHVPEVLVLADRRDPHPLLSELETAVDAAGGEVIDGVGRRGRGCEAREEEEQALHDDTGVRRR